MLPIIISLLSILGLYLLAGLLLTLLPSPVRRMIRWERGKDRLLDKKIPAFAYYLAGVLLYPSMLMEYLENRPSRKAPPPRQPLPPFDTEVVPSWLGDVISVEEAERNCTVTIRGQEIPFGYQYDSWQLMLKEMREGDCLHEFDSGPESWEMLAGCSGLALVRDGVVVSNIVSIIN